MQDLNSVALVGRLTRDIEVSYTKGGMAIGKMSVAVNSSKKEGDQWVDVASYFDITLFGKSAENLKKYLVKGQQIAISGSLKQDRWEKDGQKYNKVSIVADTIQLVGGKSGGQEKAPVAKTNLDDGFPEDVPF